MTPESAAAWAGIGSFGFLTAAAWLFSKRGVAQRAPIRHAVAVIAILLGVLSLILSPEVGLLVGVPVIVLLVGAYLRAIPGSPSDLAYRAALMIGTSLTILGCAWMAYGIVTVAGV